MAHIPIEWGTTMEHSSVGPGEAVHLLGSIEKSVSVARVCGGYDDETMYIYLDMYVSEIIRRSSDDVHLSRYVCF